MQNFYDVSIVVLSYEPEYCKLMSSLKSAIRQKGISFEVIVADDGSEIDYFLEVEQFFRQNDFKHYRLIKNQKNMGTVRNLHNAVLQSNGQYIFVNSPGDLIFDDTAMHDFYHYARENDVVVCFGDYIPYYVQDGVVGFDSTHIYPQNVKIFSKSLSSYRINFFIGWGILGASYFRSREFLINSLEYVKNYSKYTEDGTTTAYALLKETQVHYYNRKIVWYEIGTGISSGKSSEWLKRIKEDFLSTYKALQKDFPRSRILRAAIFFHENEHKSNWLLRFTMRYPIISIRKKLYSWMPKRVMVPDRRDKCILDELLNV